MTTPTPTPRDTPAWCSVLSASAGEPLAGTAPERAAWALVEHPGPWGREPAVDAPWPQDAGRLLQSSCDDAGVRLLLARRPGSRTRGGLPPRPWVTLAWTGPGRWCVTRRLDGVADLARLPLDHLAAGRRPSGWAEAGRVWGVCTHATRDPCCARIGRPLAAALEGLDAGRVWEISHSGGHRFAGVVLALPEGLMYGRVDVADLPDLAVARERGQVVVRLLRGRVALTADEQAADLALRDHLGLAELDAVVAEGAEPVGSSGVTSTWWRAGARRWRVDVVTGTGVARPASCGKDPEPSQVRRVVGVDEVPGDGSARWRAPVP